MKILMLDDHFESLCWKIKENMEALGAEVVGCTYVEEAFTYLKNHKGKETFPTMCFFDYQLDPKDEEMNGVRIAKQVLKEYQIPVVIYSQFLLDFEGVGKPIVNKAIEAKIPIAFLITKGLMEENIDWLRKFIEDVEDNYEHPDIPSPLNNEEFDLGNLKIGLRKGRGEPYEFYSKEQIYYLKGERDRSIIQVYDNISNGFVKIKLHINPGGRESNINLGLGDKIKRVFKNFHPLGDKLFVNLEKIAKYDNGMLYLDGLTTGIILNDTEKRAFRDLKLHINTERERK